ncbi:MAG: RdgB/HAM1 family non-canonical purine NTP pyrophosphatase [Methanobacteriota archaeon]|nr:MAG: RdgB/HAM1 family non-canonical purine NTP pyrophosphatase [Euryarchaeota archaeon]
MTTNDGKFREVSQQMALHGLQLEHLKMPYPELQTESLESTIIPGLLWLVSKFERPVMIDDSGLFVDALKGFPGVFSSHAFKTLGCEGMLCLLEGAEMRDARFECCIGYLAPGEDPFIAKGIAKGSISAEMRGRGGFGYDPIFVPEGRSKTYAEMEVDEKNEVSHRGIAIRKFVEEMPRLSEPGGQ